jgi:hypothetical protein
VPTVACDDAWRASGWDNCFAVNASVAMVIARDVAPDRLVALVLGSAAAVSFFCVIEEEGELAAPHGLRMSRRAQHRSYMCPSGPAHPSPSMIRTTRSGKPAPRAERCALLAKSKNNLLGSYT